jgi:hypothetical protein
MSAQGFFDAGVRFLRCLVFHPGRLLGVLGDIKVNRHGIGESADSVARGYRLRDFQSAAGCFCLWARALTWLAYGDAPKQPSASAHGSSVGATPDDATPR